ncbi:hypothetical protein CEUSTIGMA_g9222.t1 [Chlamydomonas eustigma]|uniref:Cytochrome P450 n=1 Tax=Chlamydomonas eustigma TaxID=1157962 RepID=A0A250XFD6_9CHLO|nr:hypothetical protein CEUSTIGMA_g9222.t1 [Chlamydomonas eustigma]|eukprot:GAX81794.1 hypothetical protein CEUSTIGMA_g9222.t1 [Chlamydomonas eustigma]
MNTLNDFIVEYISERPPVHVASTVISSLLAIFLIGKLLSFSQAFMYRSRVLKAVPTAPDGNWIVGHVIPMVTCVNRGMGAWDQISYWVTKAQDKTKLIKFRILDTHAVAFSDPVGLKRVFQTHYKIYEKDLKLSYHPFLPILGTGLVTSDGDLWQKQRTLMGPALRVDVLDDIITIAKDSVDRLCAKLRPLQGSGRAVDMNEEFRLLTLQVIGEAVLSMAPEECDKIFPKLYLPVMEEANLRVLRPYRQYIPTPDWFKFRSRMSQLNSFLINFFRERWQSRKQGVQRPRKDILDRIMDSIEASGAKWDSSLERQLCYEVKTFLLAGHETSAAMLTWSLFELSLCEEHMQKVRSEAELTFGSAEAEPSRRNVDAMSYTLSVLKEALRKYSVVPVVTRTLAKDDELLGHKVPAGTMVACVLQGTHNMYEDPDQFRPDRFMPGGEYEQFDDAIKAYMFVPFIQGPRNCLGQHLAMLEARVVLSLLCKRFRWKTVHGSAQGIRHPTVIPVGPLEGMPMVLE